MGAYKVVDVVIGCTFCGNARSTWQLSPSVALLQCEDCGPVCFSEVAYTTKLGTLTADDKGLWAKYFQGNKGKVHQINFGNFDQILDELRAKRDAERLGAELDRGKQRQ
jgi:hypothetical protein